MHWRTRVAEGMTEIEALQQVNAFNPLPHQHQHQPQAHQPVHQPQVHPQVFNPVHQPSVSVAGVPSYPPDGIYSECSLSIDDTFDQPADQASTAAHGEVLLIMPLPFVTSFLLHLILIRKASTNAETRPAHRTLLCSMQHCLAMADGRERLQAGGVPRRASGPACLFVPRATHRGSTQAPGVRRNQTGLPPGLALRARRAPRTYRDRTGHARLFHLTFISVT